MNTDSPLPLRAAATLAREADRLLTVLVGLVLALVLFYAGFALWDSWRIYDAAGVDASLLRYKPTAEGDQEAGFAELRGLNPDVCAWLTVTDTHIDYPVVQGADNVRYVNTDVYGNFSLSGSLFLDCRNAPDFSDRYSLIYGHHMDASVMFGELANFTADDYFARHTGGTLYLPDGSYAVRFFACLYTDAYDTQVFAPGNLSEQEQQAFLDRIRQEALQYRELDLTGQDRILALSTCSDASTNGRVVVLGRLEPVSAGEGGAAPP